MSWFSFEERWRDQILATALPARGMRPGWADLDQGEFWHEYDRSAPILLRLGFRLAVWFVVAVALLTRGRRFSCMNGGARDALLVEVANSRWYLVRQLAMTLKLVACLSYFKQPEVRRTFVGVSL